MGANGHLSEIRGGAHDVPAFDERHMFERLEELIATAAAGPPSQDPARTQTTVAFRLEDEQDAEPRPFALLLLDREPPAVERGGGTAEAELVFRRDDLARFLHGDLQLPLAIARGDVAFRGPVRKFLRIAPVLRSLARSAEAATDSNELS